MADKRKSAVDSWLERETNSKRKALENASRYFDGDDMLTVNTLESVYGRESSFGVLLRSRGASGAAGHFQLEKATAEEYGLAVSKYNDQRFNIYYAASAAARYLKDLDGMFSRKTILLPGIAAISVKNPSERKKFVLAAYNAGQGRIAKAQLFARKAGKNPRLWDDVKKFLAAAGAKKAKVKETIQYVTNILFYEIEFASKSAADKKKKRKTRKKVQPRCTIGHWVTINRRPVFICE